MSDTIEIIDRGRGPQLSTSRITMLDLAQYFNDGGGREEILRWLPLTTEEVDVAERYYLGHKEEMDEMDRRAHAYRQEQVAKHRLRFPEEDDEVVLARLKKNMQKRQQEAKDAKEVHGEGNPG